MTSRCFFPTWLPFALGLMAAVCLNPGCSRPPPLEIRVDGSSDSRLGLWKMEHAGDFTRQEWEDFEAAVQELKYGVMIAGEASGSAGVWTATLAKLDGLTVREILVLGLGQKLERLTRERDEFGQYVLHNDQLRVAPGDEASVDYLRTLRGHQDRRIEVLSEQIDATTEILRRRGLALNHPARPANKPPLSAPY